MQLEFCFPLCIVLRVSMLNLIWHFIAQLFSPIWTFSHSYQPLLSLNCWVSLADLLTSLLRSCWIRLTIQILSGHLSLHKNYLWDGSNIGCKYCLAPLIQLELLPTITFERVIWTQHEACETLRNFSASCDPFALKQTRMDLGEAVTSSPSDGFLGCA